jgi:hypothetical protein
MAMARGAKYMKVHNLPGWYNTGGNLFGETRVRPVLTQEEKNARRKPKVKSPSPVMPEYTKTSNRIYHVGKNSHHRAGMGSVYTNRAGFGYILKSGGTEYRAIVNKLMNSVKTSNKHGSQMVRAYALGNAPTQKWANLRNTSYLGAEAVIPSRPKSPNTVFNFPNVNVNAYGNKWTVPRQSGVKMYNKKSLMTKITGSIGPNSKGMGWAKVKGNFVPLIGTRAKGGGYVVNMLGVNQPRKYDDVVKGIHPFKL